VQQGQGHSGTLRRALVSPVQYAVGTTNAGQELANLGHGQILGAFDLYRGGNRFEEKVRVHERVDDAVEQYDEYKPRRLAKDRAPHDKRNARVVVHLQKASRFTLEDQDPRIDKLVVFGNVKEDGPLSKGTKLLLRLIDVVVVAVVVPQASIVAIDGGHSMLPRVREDGMPRADRDHQGKNGQEQIMARDEYPQACFIMLRW
jgi:hypothetical protein